MINSHSRGCGLSLPALSIIWYTDSMYAGVDVGGSKVLAAVLDDNGVITEHVKFPTPQAYDEFLSELAKTVADFTTKEFKAAGLAIPVTVFDRARGVAVNFGNLPWQNVPIHTDIEKLLHCPTVVENDAKLGGLSEAMLLKDTYHKVLYVTVSTGIGYALIVDGNIDTSLGDGGGRTMLLEHDGKIVPWETFASGQAIVERYGKKAADITDEATWRRIVRDLSVGFLELISMTEPEVIVVGGSVGTYFERYGSYLTEELNKYHLPLLPIPPIVGAQRPEEAVVYGCYDLARQTYGNR
jgi:predicted NBD/HSP70 family sugar kinase